MDQVACRVCGKMVGRKGLISHLQSHRMNKMEYYEKYLRKSPDEGKCKMCGKPTKMDHFVYNRYCCSKCGVKDPDVKEAKVQFFLKKYGVTSSNKLASTQENKRKTCMAKYGVDIAAKSEIVKQTTKQSLLNKYGVEHHLQLEEYQLKQRQTNLARYGKEYVAQVAENIQKTKDIKLQRYGDAVYNNRKQNKETCMKKYGVSNVSQDPTIFELIQQRTYGKKNYILPSGKVVKIQGYEDRALDELFKQGYKEEDILISLIDINDKIGKIYYNDATGKKHRYFPDFYIISENKIVEVKCKYKYTYEKNIEKNLLKKQACLDMGLNFEFKILVELGRGQQTQKL
jgi:hypothetical protein